MILPQGRSKRTVPTRNPGALFNRICRDPAQVRAGELAQETLVWVEAAAPVGEALHKMETHRVKRLPVIENHRLVGMITESDLAHSLSPRRLAAFVEKVYTTP